MLLIDGLLQEDRKRRISFDIEDATTPAVQQKEAVAKQSLRAGRRTSLQKAAVPDVIEAPIPHGKRQGVLHSSKIVYD